MPLPNESATLNAMRPRHAYVHVPFCRHRCGYCDFTLIAGRDDLIGRYLEAIRIELTRLEQPLELDTLYLGGGTPSHLGPAGLERLFAVFAPWLLPVAGAEVTIEANPLDITAEFVAAVRACGATRVSLGSQSLAATTLAALDRDHRPADVARAVALIHEAGLAVSLDLMTAAPGQSLANVEADLAAAIALAPAHLSVYCLTWEPGTAFAAARRRGDLAAVPEELERAMFEIAIDRLEAAGYEHYEVSNFARPGHRSRHNLAYWDCRPWEAFGPGAARFDGRIRTTNHRSTTTWMTRVLAGEDPTGDVDQMTAADAARERLIVGLRRRAGVERAAFHDASGLDLDRLAGDRIRRWVAAGLADDDGHAVRLTREGLLLSDSLWGELLCAEEDGAISRSADCPRPGTG